MFGFKNEKLKEMNFILFLECIYPVELLLDQLEDVADQQGLGVLGCMLRLEFEMKSFSAV